MTGSRHLRRARATLLAGAVAAALGAGFAATPARADDVTAEGAQQLQQQLHDWLAALFGPTVDLSDLPLHVTADSDHYRLEFPFANTFGDTGVAIEAEPVSASLKPLDGGRWAIDDFHAPSPLRVTYPLPNNGAGGPVTGETTITIASQEQHGVFDPSLTSPSHWDATLKGYSATTKGLKDAGTQTTSVSELTVHMGWDPAPDGRLNVVYASDGHLLASNATMPNAGLVSFSVEDMKGKLRLDDVAPDRIPPIVHAVMDLAPLGVAAAKHAEGADKHSLHALAEQNRKAAEADRLEAAADKQAVAAGTLTPDERKTRTEARIARAKARRAAMLASRDEEATPNALSPTQHTAVHDALVALADMIGGFDEQGTLENVHLIAGGHSGSLQRLAIGLSAGAPDGKVALRFHLGMDGLDSPDIPAGVFRDYLPRHISLSPRIGGVPAADLRDLMLRAADSSGQDPLLEVQARALLDKGPVTVGLDDVSLDFGPATLKGHGELRILDTDQYEGEAHFVATGLDELIKQANTVPELKDAAPVLFLVKGMGRQDGAATVWDVTYRNNKVLVNGNDLSGMLPGGK